MLKESEKRFDCGDSTACADCVRWTNLDAGFRLDLLVEDCVIVELKAVEKMNPMYEAQTMTYLRLSGTRLRYLMNFNVKHWKDGIKRFLM